MTFTSLQERPRPIYRFTKQEVEMIIRDYLDHVEVRDIARKLGRSHAVIRQKILALGLRRKSSVTYALRYAPIELRNRRSEMTDDEFVAECQKWRSGIAVRRRDTRNIRISDAIKAIDGGDGTRNAKMRAMRDAGAHLQEIGDYYNITRERVRQITDKRHLERISVARSLRGPPIRTIMGFWNKMMRQHQDAFLRAIGASRDPKVEPEMWS